MEIEIKMIVVNFCVILEKVAWNVELQKVPYFFQINIVWVLFLFEFGTRRKRLVNCQGQEFQAFL